jgi:LysR family glycine cleavage system transcriptional activator
MFKTLPPLKALVAFASASRTSNFTLAAKELHITQSAVSHQIKNLETFLGCKLFHRDGKNFELTEQGKSYALPINQSFDQMLYATEELLGQHVNTLQFGVSSSFAIHRVTPELNELYLRRPDLDIRLRMLSCSDPITAHNLDVILYDRAIDHISYECEHLKQEFYYPVAIPDIADKLKGLSAQQWANSDVLLEIESLDMWRAWLKEQDLTKSENDTQYFSHTVLILQAALSGQGIALLGENLISKELAQGKLVKLSESPISFSEDGYYFSWHKRKKNDPNIRLLKNWLLSILNTNK